MTRAVYVTRTLIVAALLVLGLSTIMAPATAYAQAEPTRAPPGTASDVTVKTPASPTLMVFMDTAATIPTGVLAERWKFSAFCVFAFVMGGIVYPVFANWVWGGGWLATLGSNFKLGHGHVDFAGSSVVHLVGGVAGLAGG